MLRILLAALLFIIPLCSDEQGQSTSAVTYKFGGGRFGDQMLTYLHAKWAAYCYKLDFYYKPFTFSDRFVLHDEDPIYTKEIAGTFDRVIKFKQWSDLESHSNGRYLYSIKYFPECLIDLRNASRRRRYFPVDWEDPEFKKEVRRLLTTKKPTRKIALPFNKVTIAVHARKGGGFDSLSTQMSYPLKFPADQYYIDQINRIDEILGSKPLHVYVFTDDPEPWKVAEGIAAGLNKPHITVKSHNPNQKKTFNLIDDLFAMTQCDCLVRPESHFSVLAGKLKDFLIEIAPSTFHRDINGTAIIDEVVIKSRL